MQQPPPINPNEGEWERGLWWMVLVSGGLHIAIVAAVFLMPHGMFLREPPKVLSYTVDLVAPNKIGGTNLLEGSKGRVQALPMASKAEPPPKVEEKPKPPPEPPKAEVEPPKPPPEPPKQVAAKVEPPPPPPKPVEEKADPDSFAEKQKKAEVKPTPSLTAAPQKVAVAKVEPTKIPPTMPSKAALEAAAKKAAEEEKAKKAAELAAKKKAADEEALKKAVETAAKRAADDQKRQAAQKAVDDKILAAVKRAEQQIGERGGGTGSKPGTAPGGPISVGPGEGAGGQPMGVDYVLYLGQLERRIKDNWAWAGSDDSLEAVVGFSIAETGEVANIKITKPSGDRGFDLSVERAVKAISPMPPPPEAYRTQFSDVEYTFSPKSLQQ